MKCRGWGLWDIRGPGILWLKTWRKWGNEPCRNERTFWVEKRASAEALLVWKYDWSWEDREAKGRKQVREAAGSRPRRAGQVTERTLAFALKKGGAPRGFWAEEWPVWVLGGSFRLLPKSGQWRGLLGATAMNQASNEMAVAWIVVAG